MRTNGADLKITKFGTYDLRNGTVYNILLKTGLSKEQLTATLLHESFVHAAEEMIKVKAINADLNLGTLQVSSGPYSDRILLTNSADADHNRLKAGSVLEYKRACQELDKLYKTNVYTKLYEEDKIHP